MKIKTLLPAVLVLGLAACGSKTYYVTDTEDPTTTVKVTKPTDAPIATSGPEPLYTDEDEFIYDIENNYDLPIYLDEQDMIETGYATCTGLQSGLSGMEVIEAVISSAEGDSRIEDLLLTIVSAAVVNFCPEQQYKFDN
jgi:hypothetical protein